MCKERTFHTEEKRYTKSQGVVLKFKKYITGIALLGYKNGKEVAQMENVEQKCFCTPINLCFLKWVERWTDSDEDLVSTKTGGRIKQDFL